MPEPSKESANLWAVIVSAGLQDEFEHDWLGRIKSKRTNAYIRVDATPEFLQMIAQTNAALDAAKHGVVSQLVKAQEALRQFAATSRLPPPPE